MLNRNFLVAGIYFSPIALKQITAPRINNTKIIDPDEYATQHVAFAYPGDSAGWYWDKHAGINSINWSDSAYNICNAVTIKVYGNSSQTANRYAQYQKIASVLK